MTAKEFVDIYNKSELKEELLNKLIKVKYIKYSEKIADCVRIIKATTEDNGVFKINSPAQFMIFAITLISKYTDIEIGDNILETFETLDEYDLINGIMGSIPERELSSYNTLLSMCNDDLMENTRSLTSYIETKLSALQISADGLLEALQKYIPENQIEEG